MAATRVGGCPPRSGRVAARSSALVLDEVQADPAVVRHRQGAVGRRPRTQSVRLHVVILGSSPLRMQSGLTESLAGRFEPIRRHALVPGGDGGSVRSRSAGVTSTSVAIRSAASLTRDSATRWRDYILRARCRAEHRAGRAGDDPRRQAGAAEAVCSSSGAGFSGSDSSRTTRCWGSFRTLETPSTLARYLDLLQHRRIDRRPAEVRQPPAPARIESQAHRAQHRAHDRCFRLLVRGSQGGPHILGPHRRERGRCASLQHRDVGHPLVLLARRPARGRLRACGAGRGWSPSRSRAGRRRGSTRRSGGRSRSSSSPNATHARRGRAAYPLNEFLAVPAGRLVRGRMSCYRSPHLHRDSGGTTPGRRAFRAHRTAGRISRDAGVRAARRPRVGQDHVVRSRASGRRPDEAQPVSSAHATSSPSTRAAHPEWRRKDALHRWTRRGAGRGR